MEVAEDKTLSWGDVVKFNTQADMWLLSLHLQIKISQSYQLSGMKTLF